MIEKKKKTTKSLYFAKGRGFAAQTLQYFWFLQVWSWLLLLSPCRGREAVPQDSPCSKAEPGGCWKAKDHVQRDLGVLTLQVNLSHPVEQLI